MLRRRVSNTGFSIVELLVVIFLVGIIATTFSSFFTNYLILYSQYQEDSTNFTELADQSQRIGNVMRGLTDIVSASANDLTAYAYFSPADTFTSQVRYYLNPTSTALLVDVTPMTANPPLGTLITANKKTYTLIANYYKAAGTNLFTYYDASGTVLTAPVADQHSILQIQTSLVAPSSRGGKGQDLSITSSLRNRKTNL